MDLESNASSDFCKLEKPTELSSIHHQIDSESEVEASSVFNLDDGARFKIIEYFNKRGELLIGNENDAEPALYHCSRLIASSFLLSGIPGELVPDDIFRVSVKSLALSCLAYIFKLVPEMMMCKLEVSGQRDQMISDILKFSKHSDPQIRGNIAILVGCFLRGILNNAISLENCNGKINFEACIQIILEVVFFFKSLN